MNLVRIRAKELNKGDHFLLVGGTYVVTKIDDSIHYAARSSFGHKKKLYGVGNRLVMGKNNNQWVEKIVE